jgi:polar amino acid transport system substrate-binding protein
MPWKRAMSLAERGKKAHALLGCFYTKEREKVYNFSKEISSAAFHFLMTKKKFTKKITSPSHLKNLILGKVRGYATSEKLKNFKGLKQVKKVNKITQLFGMLERGKVDVILENPLVARFEFNKKYPGKDYPLKDAGPDFPASDGSLSGGLHICWSKRNKEVKVLLPHFDEGLKAIKANGTYDKVRKEFGLK